MPPKTKGHDELSIMKYFFELITAQKVDGIDEEMKENLIKGIHRHSVKACDFYTKLSRWPTNAEASQMSSLFGSLKSAQNEYNSYKKRRDNYTPGTYDFQIYAAKTEGFNAEVEYWDREANQYIDSLLKPEKPKESTAAKRKKKTADTGEPDVPF